MAPCGVHYSSKTNGDSLSLFLRGCGLRFDSCHSSRRSRHEPWIRSIGGLRVGQLDLGALRFITRKSFFIAQHQSVTYRELEDHFVSNASASGQLTPGRTPVSPKPIRAMVSIRSSVTAAAGTAKGKRCRDLESMTNHHTTMTDHLRRSGTLIADFLLMATATAKRRTKTEAREDGAALLASRQTC